MRTRAKALLAKCFVPGLMGLMTAPTFLPAEQVVASSNQSISLSYTQVDSVTGKIQVTLGSGTEKVLLPDGNYVTTNTSYTVTDNGVYDFVAYDTRGRPTQHHITVSGLDVDPAPLTTANGLYLKLNVSSFDTLSKVESYRYKLDNSSSWSSWIPYKENNSQEIRIPVVDSAEPFIDERAVQVEVRDHAGNIARTESKFRVDHYFPEIEPYNETIYTNKEQIFIPLVTKSYFKNPEKLMIKEGSKVKNVDLTKFNHEETLLERRPNLIKADWGQRIPYELDKKQGKHEIELIVVKAYEDFKGNRTELPSNANSKHSITVVYDTEAPTGTITIRADEKNEVRSHDVILDLTFSDELSGIEKVRVFEKDNPNKEYILTTEEIKGGSISLPWTLSLGKDGQVLMEVTDKAGNTAVYDSNKVTISNIQVSGFVLTDVVNPAGPYKEGGVITDFPSDGLSWQFDGTNVRMVAGGNFSFKIYYDVGYVDLNRYKVTGKYKVKMIHDGEIVYESEDIEFNPNEQPVGEQFFNPEVDILDDLRAAPWYDGGFETTFTLPSVQTLGKHAGKPFKDGTEVYLSVTLEREEKADGTKLYTTFEQPGTDGNLIGVVGHYGGAMSLEDMVRFNEKN